MDKYFVSVNLKDQENSKLHKLPTYKFCKDLEMAKFTAEGLVKEYPTSYDVLIYKLDKVCELNYVFSEVLD